MGRVVEIWGVTHWFLEYWHAKGVDLQVGVKAKGMCMDTDWNFGDMDTYVATYTHFTSSNLRGERARAPSSPGP